jgi:hypothetical protein
VDGELLGRRVLPFPKQPDFTFLSGGNPGQGASHFLQTGTATIGRFLLMWEAGPAGPTLTLFDPWEERPVWPPRKFAAGARASLVAGEAVGVLERDGHFILLGLPDGQTIADTTLPLQLPGLNPITKIQLQLQPQLTALSVLRLEDQYLVVAHLPPKRGQSISPLNGMVAQPIPSGKLFALDRQGKLQWPSPVAVEGQCLLLNQPAGLPVIVLAGQMYDQRRRKQLVSIQAIDRRSGRVVYDKQSEIPAMALDLVGNGEQKTVELRVQGGGRPLGGTVVLHFTDKPISDKPADQASPGAPSASAKQPPGRILDALRHAIEQPLGSIVPIPEEEAESDPFGQ